MNDVQDSKLHWRLKLDNIGECIFRAVDDGAGHMIETLAHVMRMQSLVPGSAQFAYPQSKLFDVQMDGPLDSPIPVKPPLVAFARNEGQNRELITIRGVAHPDVRFLELNLLSSGMVRYFETLGGALIHGALVERNGYGVILAGPSQIGKTTSCARLPDGWHALSDDATLIVPTSKNTYAANPWPTWSRLMYNGPGGSWDVARGVPLRAMFFLRRGEIDQALRMGEGEAACMLMSSIRQISQIQLSGVVPDTCLRDIYTMQFDNVCAIARRVSNWHLTISPKGRFHEEIDHAVEMSSMGAEFQ